MEDRIFRLYGSLLGERTLDWCALGGVDRAALAQFESEIWAVQHTFLLRRDTQSGLPQYHD